MTLTREQILAAPDRKTLAVPVPEWGGEIFVRSLTGSERDALEWSIKEASERGALGRNARARFAVAFTADGEGNPIFQPEDVDALGAKSAAVLDRIWEAGSKLNALREADIEELAKNSEPSRAASSPSA